MTQAPEMPHAPAAVAQTGRSASHLILTIALIESLSGITQGYINPIIPGLGSQWDMSDSMINAIFVISNVAFAVLSPIVPRLGDTYGYRLWLRVSILLTVIGSLLMAVIPTRSTVIVGVVLITTVVGFVPLMMGILRVAHPARAKDGTGVIIGVLQLTTGLGGLLAGWVGMHTPTRGFWVAVPFAVLALACSFKLPNAGSPSHERIPVPAMLACSVGLIGVVTSLSMGPSWGWSDVRTIGSGVFGIGLLVVWVVLDVHARNPFVDLGSFRIGHLRVNGLATFFFGFASISYFGTNGIFLASDKSATGFGFGFDSMQIAWVVGGMSVFSLAAAFGTARLLRNAGGRNTLMLAGLLMGGGFLLMIPLRATLAGYGVAIAVFALGMGMYQAAVRPLSVEGVPVHETATAAGFNELALSIGVAVGVAVIQLLQASNDADGHLTAHGLTLIQLLLAAAALVGLAISTGYRMPNSQEEVA